jgi:uncharacterized protein YceK
MKHLPTIIVLLFLLAVICLSGCASVTYTAPDGAKVSYSRLFVTADSLKVKVGMVK